MLNAVDISDDLFHVFKSILGISLQKPEDESLQFWRDTAIQRGREFGDKVLMSAGNQRIDLV